MPTLTANVRKALYGLIPAVILALTTYGVLTQTRAVLWTNVLTLAVGLGYAAAKATGNRLLDPGVRRSIYVLLPAIVALVGGYVSLDVGLWTSVATAVLASILAIWNVDPDEIITTTYNSDTDTFEPTPPTV